MTTSPMLGLSIHELEAELKSSEATFSRLIDEQSRVLSAMDFHLRYAEALRAEIGFRRTAYTPVDRPKTIAFSMIETEVVNHAEFTN